MLSPGVNELKLFDFPLCLKMEPAKSGGPGIFLQYTQPVKWSSNIRIPGHIVIERKSQWLRAPSTTSWTSADKVENKFGSNPLYLTKTKLIPIIQGVSTLWDRPNVITNAYELQKKICSDEHRDWFGDNMSLFSPLASTPENKQVFSETECKGRENFNVWTIEMIQSCAIITWSNFSWYYITLRWQ